MSENIPMLDFSGIHDPLEDEFLASFKEFLTRKWYVLGKEVVDFEQEYARFLGQKYSVGLSSGMAALHLSLISLNIGAGDEVIVPAHTYVATWLAVSYVNAIPVPVEPDPLTRNISVKGIKAAITARTKLIIPVHMYGLPCDMPAILDLAKKYQIPVVEDNAQGHGAKIFNRLTGSFGIINAHSFYPTKNLGAFGEAGAISTNDRELALRIKTLRNYGAKEKYINTEIGYNYRLDELQAAFLNVKLKYLDSWINERSRMASIYHDHLHPIIELILPGEFPGIQHAYHLYVIESSVRDKLRAFLSAKGIQTLIHYPVPPHLQKAYQHLKYEQGHFPIAERLAKESLSLPFYIGLKNEQIITVCNAIRQFFRVD